MFNSRGSVGRWLGGAAITLALAAGLWLAGNPPVPDAPPMPEPVAPAPPSARAPDAGPAPAEQEGRAAVEPGTPSRAPLPEQAAVTEALGGLQWDRQGRLRVDAEVRAHLDALFIEPETPIDPARFETLKRRILAALPDDKSRQVLEVVERYYHYSSVYRDLADNFRYLGSEEEIARGQRQLYALRRDYLGAELAEALFGEEERMMRVTLENMRIQSDPTLTEAQKRERQQPLNGTQEPDEDR